MMAQRIAECAESIRKNPHSHHHTLSLEGCTLTELPDNLPEGLTYLVLNQTELRVLDGARLPTSLYLIDARNTHIHTVRNLGRLTKLIGLTITWSVHLDVFDTDLPDSLQSLDISNSMCVQRIRNLERTKIRHLVLHGCSMLTHIPELPSTLRTLVVDPHHVLPFLPDSLEYIRGPRDWGHTETIREYINLIQQTQRKTIAKSRFDSVHEELVAAMWHPRRVSAWLEAGVLDMLLD